MPRPFFFTSHRPIPCRNIEHTFTHEVPGDQRASLERQCELSSLPVTFPFSHRLIWLSTNRQRNKDMLITTRVSASLRSPFVAPQSTRRRHGHTVMIHWSQSKAVVDLIVQYLLPVIFHFAPLDIASYYWRVVIYITGANTSVIEFALYCGVVDLSMSLRNTQDLLSCIVAPCLFASKSMARRGLLSGSGSPHALSFTCLPFQTLH